MSRSIRRIVLAMFVLGFMLPSLALARAPKKYQVTGKVLELTDDVIVVDKGDEKWEIGREAATKVDGKLKVGMKVTIEYTMTASKVDVKDEKAPDKKTAEKAK
jgi:hypothetical protein